MPDSHAPDPTERLLSGTDAPRPLPPELRRRLAEQLLAGAPAGARPLPTALRSRLEEALPGGEEPGEAAESDGSGGRAWWASRRWTSRVFTGAAAAAVLLVAVVGLALHGGGGSQPSRVAGSALTSKGAHGTAGSPFSAGPERSATAGGATTGSSAASGGSGLTNAGSSTGSGIAGTAGAASGGAESGGASAGPASPAAAPAPVPPPPVVSGVSPIFGPMAGGTWVTVTGQHLGEATAVRFGTVAGTKLAVLSDTQVRILAPAHQPGPVDITVVTPGGTSPTTSADRYTYVP